MTKPDTLSFVITIDGPAGAGKSTVAKTLARRLGAIYLDTGAMYRAVALACLRRGVDLSDSAAVAEVARTCDLEFLDGFSAVMVDGVDSTSSIRSEEVTDVVSVVAANPRVRELMVIRQRQLASAPGIVIAEGRDMGSVVFPDAILKVFLTASSTERARRRTEEMGGTDVAAAVEKIERRDEADSSRAASPFVVPQGAIMVNTDSLTAEQVVERVHQLFETRISTDVR